MVASRPNSGSTACVLTVPQCAWSLVAHGCGTATKEQTSHVLPVVPFCWHLQSFLDSPTEANTPSVGSWTPWRTCPCRTGSSPRPSCTPCWLSALPSLCPWPGPLPMPPCLLAAPPRPLIPPQVRRTPWLSRKYQRWPAHPAARAQDLASNLFVASLSAHRTPAQWLCSMADPLVLLTQPCMALGQHEQPGRAPQHLTGTIVVCGPESAQPTVPWCLSHAWHGQAWCSAACPTGCA